METINTDNFFEEFYYKSNQRNWVIVEKVCEVKGRISFKTGDISLHLKGSEGNPGKRKKNDDTGKRIDKAREISLNEKEGIQC